MKSSPQMHGGMHFMRRSTVHLAVEWDHELLSHRKSEDQQHRDRTRRFSWKMAVTVMKC